MPEKHKIILPISILLASIILGGFYYATQTSKQRSTEKQELMKIEAERRKREEERIQQEKEKNDRDKCFSEAAERAKSLMKTKAELSGGERYKEGAEKDLFVKDDFNSYYENCLSRKGLKK